MDDAHRDHAGRKHSRISGHDAKTNPGAFRDLADVDTVVVFMGGKHRERGGCAF